MKILPKPKMNIDSTMGHFNPHDNNQHFFVSNVYGWASDANLFEAIKKAKKWLPTKKNNKFRGTPPNGWYMVIVWVPLPANADYSICNYLPEVEGAVKIFEGEM
jgi:hypothetical protein